MSVSPETEEWIYSDTFSHNHTQCHLCFILEVLAVWSWFLRICSLPLAKHGSRSCSLWKSPIFQHFSPMKQLSNENTPPSFSLSLCLFFIWAFLSLHISPPSIFYESWIELAFLCAPFVAEVSSEIWFYDIHLLKMLESLFLTDYNTTAPKETSITPSIYFSVFTNQTLCSYLSVTSNRGGLREDAETRQSLGSKSAVPN